MFAYKIDFPKQQLLNDEPTKNTPGYEWQKLKDPNSLNFMSDIAQNPLAPRIETLVTPWTGTGFTYFSNNSKNDLIVNHIGFHHADAQDTEWLYRFNIASKQDGSLLLSKTRQKTEKKNHLIKNCCLHMASFDPYGNAVFLKGKTQSLFDPAYYNPHKQVKNLVEEAHYILQQSNRTIMHTNALYDENMIDIIPLAEHMLEVVSHTHHKNHLYIP